MQNVLPPKIQQMPTPLVLPTIPDEEPVWRRMPIFEYTAGYPQAQQEPKSPTEVTNATSKEDETVPTVVRQGSPRKERRRQPAQPHPKGKGQYDGCESRHEFERYVGRGSRRITGSSRSNRRCPALARATRAHRRQDPDARGMEEFSNVAVNASKQIREYCHSPSFFRRMKALQPLLWLD